MLREHGDQIDTGGAEIERRRDETAEGVGGDSASVHRGILFQCSPRWRHDRLESAGELPQKLASVEMQLRL